MADDNRMSRSYLKVLYSGMLCIAILFFSLPLGLILFRYLPFRIQHYIPIFPVIMIIVLCFVATAARSGIVWQDREPTRPDNPAPAPGVPLQKNAGLAAILSLAAPGMGQHYCGRHVRGCAIAIFTAIGLICFIIPGIIIWLAGIIDAFCTAQKVNDGSYPYTDIPPSMLLAGTLATPGLLVFCLAAGILIMYGRAGVVMIGDFLGMPS